MPTPAATGRGEWSKRGNLLASSYYSKGASAGLAACDTQDKWAVNRAVWAIQKLLNKAGWPFEYSSAPGVFGAKTDEVVRKYQAANALTVDGIVGPQTSKSLLRDIVAAEEKTNGIPNRLLWGQVGAESSWDTGCIGYTTPKDVGICQINLYYNQSISCDQAADPLFAVPLSAKRLRTRYNEYKVYGKTDALTWDAAVLSHNSPANALKLIKTGTYPTAQSKAYVDMVKRNAAVK